MVIPRRRWVIPVAFWLFVLASFEVGLRVARFEFNPYAHYSQKDWGVFVEGRNRVDYLADPDVFWRFIPTRILMSEFGPGAHINSAGLRGPECKIAADKAVYRIVTLGDSGTFGWSVKDEECYPRRLEAILNEKLGPGRVEVINGGVPGFTSLQGARWFEKHLLNYRPDIVTVAFGGNDPDTLPMSDKDRKLAPSMLKMQEWILHARICQFVYKTLAVDLVSYKREDASKWPERVSVPDFIANNEKIVELTEKLGGKVVFIARPGPRPIEYMGAVEQVAKRHNYPFIPDGVFGHPPAADYHAVAARIADAIMKENWISAK